MVVFDAVALVGVLWLSYQLRLGGTFEPTGPQWVLILLAPVVALPVFLRLGLYRRLWALADIASFVTTLRRPHADTTDMRHAYEALVYYLG